jgi:hypothetical protein
MEHYSITNNRNDKWTETKLFIKNSNRSAATHLKTKLALIGYMLDDDIEKSELDKIINWIIISIMSSLKIYL